MFLVDITMHRNEPNLLLQGPGKTVIALFEAGRSFVAKLDVYTRDPRAAKTWTYLHLNGWISKTSRCS